MTTMSKVKANSAYQFSFKWWVEQIIVAIIALVVCLLGSINFV